MSLYPQHIGLVEHVLKEHVKPMYVSPISLAIHFDTFKQHLLDTFKNLK